MNSRRRAQAAAAAVAALLLAACNRDPAEYPHGEQAASGTDGSALRTLALYVAIPLVLMALIAAASWLTSRGQGTRRYRPQEGWSAAPVWFAGPSGDPVAAVEQGSTGEVQRGGSGGSW